MIDRQRRRMFVLPAEGLRVRLHHDPRKMLPAGGAWVPMTTEWQRALADGDVVLPPPAKKRKRKKTEE